MERPDSDTESPDPVWAPCDGKEQAQLSGPWIEVGGVRLPVEKKQSLLVPELPAFRGWTAGDPNHAELESIRWMMQKAAMSQD